AARVLIGESVVALLVLDEHHGIPGERGGLGKLVTGAGPEFHLGVGDRRQKRATLGKPGGRGGEENKAGQKRRPHGFLRGVRAFQGGPTHTTGRESVKPGCGGAVCRIRLPPTAPGSSVAIPPHPERCAFRPLPGEERRSAR